MHSPFPGMDPYLEGHLWPDVHQSLAYIIKKYLIPQVRPKYAVTLNVYTIEDTTQVRILALCILMSKCLK